MKAFLEAGKIVNTHGVRGEVKMEPWSDEPDFLKDFSTVYVENRAYALQSVRVYKRFAFLTLDGVDSVEQAMAMRDRVVSIRREDAKLPEHTYFVSDMVGLEVYDLRLGKVIGKLEELMELPAGRIYSIDNGRIMIPDRPEFLRGVDMEKGVITVETIPGMGDEGVEA